jgi:hypothetical protein
MILFLGATLLIVTEVTARLQKANFDTCPIERPGILVAIRAKGADGEKVVNK